MDCSFYPGVAQLVARLLWEQDAGRSSRPTRTTSEQALYRLLRLFFKNQSALMPLLLLSKSNPLRWASICFLVQTWKLQHLYCCDVANKKTPDCMIQVDHAVRGFC